MADYDNNAINAGAISDDDTVAVQLHELNVDITPNAFSLGADVVNANPGSAIVRSFTVAGITANEPALFSATGVGQVSLDGENFSASVNALLGSRVYVLGIAGAIDQVVECGVECNGISDSFTITTRGLLIPSITTQPRITDTYNGGYFTLSVAGDNISTYQWYQVGVGAIAGANSSVFTRSAVLADDGSEFYVIVTSTDGESEQSDTVVLFVYDLEAPIVPDDSEFLTPARRTIVVDRRDTFKQAVAGIMQQDYSERYDYMIDLARWLEGDSILQASWAPVTGIYTEDQAVNDTQCLVWVRGGVPGETYRLLCIVDTVYGRKHKVWFDIDIVDETLA